MEKKEKQLIRFLKESNIYIVKKNNKNLFRQISRRQGYFSMQIMEFCNVCVFLKINPVYISEILKENENILREFWENTYREIIIDLKNPYLNRIEILIKGMAYKKIVLFDEIKWQKYLFEFSYDTHN